jgi:hypothetical protein
VGNLLCGEVNYILFLVQDMHVKGTIIMSNSLLIRFKVVGDVLMGHVHISTCTNNCFVLQTLCTCLCFVIDPLPLPFSFLSLFFYYCFIISQWHNCSEDLSSWIGLFLMDALDWH